MTSSAGRSFRSRSPERVLDELARHHHELGATRFVFTDLKLNSDLHMWRSIIAGAQSSVPGGHWIGAVHVGREADNGLSDDDLRAAAGSGCIRLTTGLESGSQRLLDLMKKGTRLERMSAFLHGAAAAGISTRCTMILGYPGETAADVHASADFLHRHRQQIERVSLNRLALITGTALQRSVARSPSRVPGFRIVAADAATAQVEHVNDSLGSVAHRRGVMRLLTEVHRINVRELSPRAREFEGVM